MEEPQFTTEKAKRDYSLVCAARDKGDEGAFAALMGFYKEPIYQMMLRMTNNADDADDLTMETFSKAFLQLNLYIPTNSFSTWLFTIGTNTFIDRVRRKRVSTVPMSSITSPDGEEEYELPVPSTTPNPEEELVLQQRKERLREVVSKLDVRYRQVVEMRFYEDLSYEEIAQRLKIPLGTVKVRLSRARKLLASIIGSQAEPI